MVAMNEPGLRQGVGVILEKHMTFLDKHIGSDGRKYDRFVFKDNQAWSLWLNHACIESSWVQDLNSVGMQTLVPRHSTPQVGEKVKVQVLLHGQRVIFCEAKVKWMKEVEGQPELSSLGLEFVDPFYRVAKAWQEANLRSFLVKR